MTIKNSVEHFCYSGTINDECIFNWSIENFSMHSQKGCRTSSPIFESKSGSQWCLNLSIEEVSIDEKCVEFITVHLENHKCSTKQFVKVKLSICNRFGAPVESNYEKVLFDSWTTTSCQKVFSISKDYVMEELLGLNRMLLVPNDVFTVRCEMTIAEESPAVMLESRNACTSNGETCTSESDLFVLWCTEVLLFLRPALFRGKEGIIVVYKILRELCIFAWPIIVFLAPIVFKILCFISIQCKDLILWSYKICTTPEGKKPVFHPSAHQQPTYMRKYANNRPQNYIVTEHDMRRLFHFLNSQKFGSNGPRAVKGIEESRKWPKLTYTDKYY